jgi:hypothetical protein
MNIQHYALSVNTRAIVINSLHVPFFFALSAQSASCAARVIGSPHVKSLLVFLERSVFEL